MSTKLSLQIHSREGRITSTSGKVPPPHLCQVDTKGFDEAEYPEPLRQSIQNPVYKQHERVTKVAVLTNTVEDRETGYAQHSQCLHSDVRIQIGVRDAQGEDLGGEVAGERDGHNSEASRLDDEEHGVDEGEGPGVAKSKLRRNQKIEL